MDRARTTESFEKLDQVNVYAPDTTSESEARETKPRRAKKHVLPNVAPPVPDAPVPIEEPNRKEVVKIKAPSPVKKAARSSKKATPALKSVAVPVEKHSLGEVDKRSITVNIYGTTTP